MPRPRSHETCFFTTDLASSDPVAETSWLLQPLTLNTGYRRTIIEAQAGRRLRNTTGCQIRLARAEGGV
ncbi:hypothetical protein GJ744_005298 [Endocarpon pusillum]|uniref:Uncharacterized protein n=1 Tax=Endocarpon pusillum TaxID=364733 RepID=A0A8H7AN57_9EURO|nr:hypothetical protein GJ744_005298 [Endocarpon pusillum]